MLDVNYSYKRYGFLGNEFLTWLWFLTENEPKAVSEILSEPVILTLGNRIALEKKYMDDIEKVTVKGDTARMDEGLLALRKGAVVSEAHWVMELADQKWTFTMKGASLDITGLKCPPTAPVRAVADIEGAVIEKAALVERPVKAVTALFSRFLTLRISSDWEKTEIPRMKKWISGKPVGKREE